MRKGAEHGARRGHANTCTRSRTLVLASLSPVLTAVAALLAAGAAASLARSAAPFSAAPAAAARALAAAARAQPCARGGGRAVGAGRRRERRRQRERRRRLAHLHRRQGAGRPDAGRDFADSARRERAEVVGARGGGRRGEPARERVRENRRAHLARPGGDRVAGRPVAAAARAARVAPGRVVRGRRARRARGFIAGSERGARPATRARVREGTPDRSRAAAVAIDEATNVATKRFVFYIILAEARGVVADSTAAGPSPRSRVLCARDAPRHAACSRSTFSLSATCETGIGLSSTCTPSYSLRFWKRGGAA